LNATNLGRAQYNICLMGQVTHHLTATRNQDIFRRVHAALKAYGKLVLDVPMGTGGLDEHSNFLSLVFWGIFGGIAYTSGDYFSWLEEAGFHEVKQLSERWIMAKSG